MRMVGIVFKKKSKEIMNLLIIPCIIDVQHVIGHV
jgi:hypothetical protein